MQISLAYVRILVLSNPYQVQPFWARVDLGAMEGYSAFPKTPASQELYYQIV